jgi:glycosyltransferase involved in cell wall biosynthesis
MKIHFHTDCPFFGGCENMLSNFFNSKKFIRSHNVTFSYRHSKAYASGLKNRVMNDSFPMYPLIFPELSNYSLLPDRIPLLIRRAIMAAARLVFTLPLFIYEVYRLSMLFKKLRPDIVHINNGGYPAALSARAAAVAARYAGVSKVVMVVNNMAIGYRHYSRWQEYPIDRLVVLCVDVFVTGSHAAGQQLASVLRLPDSQLKNIHNGISLRSITEPILSTRNRLGVGSYCGLIFGVVALFIPRKGHIVLLEAISSLIKAEKVNENNLKFLIEGSGILKKELKDYVRRNNLGRCVQFVGVEENVIDFINAIDVLVLPSVEDEDFPNIILEAMALCKPVIASRIAGIPEQVANNVTGYLVEPKSVVELADAICRIVHQDKKSRVMMGLAAQKRFEQCFLSSIAVEKYTNFYKKLQDTNI